MTDVNRFETITKTNITHNPEKMDDMDDAIFERKPPQNIIVRITSSLREKFDRCRDLLNEI